MRQYYPRGRSPENQDVDAQHGCNGWSPSGARDGSRCDSRTGKAGRRSDPAKGAGGLSPLAEGRNDQPVRCAVTDNHIFFVWQERLLFSPKLSGASPNYERVLPKSHALNRNDLRSALERVAQFTESKTRCLVVEVSTNQLCVRTQEGAVAESEESVATLYAASPRVILFQTPI
jgi:DNA polymerase III sliding clamp (beta) subunit (PCNA family)